MSRKKRSKNTQLTGDNVQADNKHVSIMELALQKAGIKRQDKGTTNSRAHNKAEHQKKSGSTQAKSLGTKKKSVRVAQKIKKTGLNTLASAFERAGITRPSKKEPDKKQPKKKNNQTKKLRPKRPRTNCNHVAMKRCWVKKW